MTLQTHGLSFWPITQKMTTETRSATTRAREVDLDAIERFFVVGDRNAVRSFVTQRPFLAPLLFEAHQEIGALFGSAALHLAVVTDPEDDTRHLTLTIMSARAADAAVERLHQLDEQWWLDALDRARGALSISVSNDDL